MTETTADTQTEDIAEIALGWYSAGQGAALATVVETWGSAPRPPGSQMAVSGQGAIMGSVSGGCVEGAVVAEALDAIADGRPRLLSFGVSDDDAFAVGLACGGRIRVLVEPVGTALPVDLLQQLVRSRAARQALAYVVDLESWDRRLVSPGAGTPADITERFRADRSGIDGAAFVQIRNPALRLAVIGAVHIAQSLVPMARACGYDCLVIDPRPAFASPQRFPGVVLSTDWPDAALAAFGPDARSAVVTLTHDSKLDDPALLAALASPAFYIGCLGSVRTHARRLDRMRAAGVDEAALARLHAPVGLAIGARSPAEIAVSVLAQITQVLRQG